MAEHDGICTDCRFWRPLSSYRAQPKACHCLIDSGTRNGKHGNKCSTYSRREPESGTRRKTPWDAW